MGEGLDADTADGHNNKEDNDETWSRPGYDRRCEPGSQVVESGVIRHDMRHGSDCLNAEWIRLTEQGKVITSPNIQPQLHSSVSIELLSKPLCLQ